MTRTPKTAVLFLENRSITDIWSGVANLLQSDFECRLLRFNRAFGNNFPGEIVDLRTSSPSFDKLAQSVESFIQTILQTDRASYLHCNTETEIRSAVLSVFKTLKQMKFDVVIGEVTSVYERAVEFYCRNNGITFLAPMTARIPADRFFFLDGSALYPLPIAAEPDKNGLMDDAVETAQRNAGKNDLAMALERHVRLRNTVRTLAGWLNGERLHTPSPWRKVILKWKRQRGIANLNKRPLTKVENIDEQSVVYFMHVQPESTLDTYSPNLWDQARTIREIAEACRIAQRPFFVRPHPRGKHEGWLHLSEIQASLGVRVLSPLVDLQEVLKCNAVIVTVSGTVLFEAAAAGAPTVALDHSYISSFPGVTQVSLANFGKILSGEIECASATPKSQREWFESINRFNHKGLICPPEWSSEALSSKNLTAITAGMRFAINWCTNSTSSMPE
jgi:hypothetical protein